MAWTVEPWNDTVQFGVTESEIVLVDRSYIHPAFTYTRPSAGTYFDRLGTLKTAVNDEPRFEYDPSTGLYKGLKLEQGRTSESRYSEQYETTYYTKTNCTVDEEQAQAPDGEYTADKLIADGAGECRLWKGAPTNTEDIDFTYGTFLKAGNVSIAGLSTYAPRTGFGSIQVDLTNGNIVSGNGDVIDCGNGWYWVSSWFTPTSTGSFTKNYVRFMATAPGDYVYAWGAQSIQGVRYFLSYIKTTTASSSKAHSRLRCLNLQEIGFRQGEGTLLFELETLGVTTEEVAQAPQIYNLTGSGADRIYCYISYFSQRPYHFIRDDSGGVSTVNNEIQIQNRQPVKFAVSYSRDAHIVGANGDEPATIIPTRDIPIMNVMELGGYGNSSLNGNLKSAKYIPRAYTSDEINNFVNS
ncbi:hypothetical protein OO185_02525 [Prosthecochloris sp. SCSIO W1102]|uniref:phage head spike fiber domain-containing protein n=1 Tax=Prosthecochloris sp. SCSIO W1102 TaxID=2992243 RepID=UPI00223E5B2A|nr:hypothetical protein [Prosthecochloris sp. SCSIO W1102]UZJ39996.1 hypothetical protein OO185_02525 [Prosthecochloris sp. SCSIO W1102]